MFIDKIILGQNSFGGIMRILISLFLVFIATSLYAQYDSLAVEIVGDTVIITNFSAYENCCSGFLFDIQQENDSILYITEIDTGDLCTCNCYFDLEIKITDLALGEYVAKVYRDWETFDRPVMFIGEIHFNFYPKDLSIQTFSFVGTQGPCYHITGIEDKEPAPKDFKLLSAYPNPFNPTTNIEYTLRAIHESPQHVNLSIYNLLGQKVATLVNKTQAAGRYNVEWNAADFPSGIYFYSLFINNSYSDSKKLVLLK